MAGGYIIVKTFLTKTMKPTTAEPLYNTHTHTITHTPNKKQLQKIKMKFL